MDFLIFVFILSILVLAHEGGHFFSAKKSGIRVEEFGFGIPPRLFGKKIGETIYSINLFPFGGFVRLFGEEAEEMGEAKAAVREREELRRLAFFCKPKRVRVLVLTAGVIMNLLLGVLLFSGLYTAIGIPTPVDKVQVIGIAPGSPAEAVFELGDEIVGVAGLPVASTDEFKRLVEQGAGAEIRFVLKRNELTTEAAAVPRLEPPEEEGSLGVVIAPKIEYFRYPLWQMPFRGGWFGLTEAYSWGKTIVSELGKMVYQLLLGNLPREVGGPVEIYFLIAEVAEVGLVPLIQLTGILSINLAIINLLPIPGFDGGHLMFIAIEAIRGKRVNQRVERITNAVGFAFLLALMLLITVQDVLRRFPLAEWLGMLFKRQLKM